MSLLRTLRTVRHLKPSQVLWRLRYAMERRTNSHSGTPGNRWAWTKPTLPALGHDFPELPTPPFSGPRGAAAVEKMDSGQVEHLGQSEELGGEIADWRLGDCPSNRLWTITLHYHEWAFALAEAAASTPKTGIGPRELRAASHFRHYVLDWIQNCGIERPGSSALAWNSYAISTRLGWWIRSYRVARSEIFDDHKEFEDLFLRSLWQQAAYLHDHLEWDLRANHLMRDLVGLALAGRFFRHEKARRWLQRASRLALEQTSEQVLPDGGNFERSPKYHLDVMEDLLQLALLTPDNVAREALHRSWVAMAEWISWMRHPDGGTTQFNDGALISAEAVENHLRAGERLGLHGDSQPRKGGKYFAYTGLVVHRGPTWTVFFDVGPLGPNEQPGHGHADTLSFECSYRGRRLVVDPGTFSYDADQRRAYDRGTAAHNTVLIDDQDSSEIWHIFRVGRRASPRDVNVTFCEEGLRAEGAHDGYDHLPGRPRHHRTLTVDDRGRILRVHDDVRSGRTHRLQGGLLIEPDWEVRPTAVGWIAQSGDDSVSIILEGADVSERILEERWYHPDYGIERRATWIGWRRQGFSPSTVRWTLMAGACRNAAREARLR